MKRRSASTPTRAGFPPTASRKFDRRLIPQPRSRRTSPATIVQVRHPFVVLLGWHFDFKPHCCAHSANRLATRLSLLGALAVTDKRNPGTENLWVTRRGSPGS